MKLTRDRLKQIIKEELEEMMEELPKLGVSGNTTYTFGYEYLKDVNPSLAQEVFVKKSKNISPDIQVAEIYRKPAIVVFAGGKFEPIEPQEHVALSVPSDSPTNEELKKLSREQHAWWESRVPKGMKLQRINGIN